jgi:glycosyltransferase involved in cell wall biosynthesis
MKVVVAQLGARMHYAIPRMLHDAGMLERLFTDICAVKGWPRWLHSIPQSLRPHSLKRLLDRIPRGVPLELITAFTRFGQEYARRRALSRSVTELTSACLWAGRQMCEQVLVQDWGRATGVYTFNSAGLEVLKAARQRGLYGIMEQTIAPYRIERQLLQKEHEHFPDWEDPLEADERLAEYAAREEAEWQHANLILCGSEFVRQGIAECGGPAEKCQVVPYGVDISFGLPDRPQGRSGPLRVLTVGAIGLRKGSPYVLETARRLKGKAEFRMVGSVGIRSEALARLREHVEVIGPVPRSEILKQYAWADVFFLPSLCEGSATVTYEALACGLPVVTTPNTGSIVHDGEEGFIVPVRDVDAMENCLGFFAAHSAMLKRFSTGALALSKSITLVAYSERLIAALRSSASRTL